MDRSAHDVFQLSDKQFNLIYNQALAAELEKLEKQQKQALSYKYIIWAFGIVLGSGCVLLSILSDAPVYIMGIVIGFLAIWVGEEQVIRYKRAYKDVVIPQLLKHTGADLAYTSEPEFSAKVLNNCGLISEHVDRIKAEDGIEGYLGQTAISVAELNATRGSGRYKVTVFDGLFCSAKFAESFDGWVWVYPESKIVGNGTWIGDILASWGLESFESSDRVRFDSKFETYFRAYGSSPKEVETVLTPKLIANLIDLYRESEKVALTVSGNQVYVAIWTNNDYLEPNPALPAKDRQAVQTKLYELEMMLSIIEDLNVQQY